MIFAIETSCDETAVAIRSEQRLIASLVTSQLRKHQPFGGVLPELATRLHVVNLPLLAEKIMAQTNLSWPMIDYITYTAHPGLPSCLHAGSVFAQTLSLILNKPLLPINHLHAHLFANYINRDNQYQSTTVALGLVISGGHTHLYLLIARKIILIGHSLDDAVGECLDKVGRVLGFDYPAGATIEQWALKGQPKYRLPIPQTTNGLNFSFSGLKTAAIQKIAQLKQQDITHTRHYLADFCASLQQTIIKILLQRLTYASLCFPIAKLLLIGGGVSSNMAIRRQLHHWCKQKKISFWVPDREFCTDNAAMIAETAYRQIIFTQN